ncbi:histidine kinase [Salipaludibacillus sp. HK11]|uniref:histidine kinase n=1 Tax=Salipaludibacillus sp. HK11 TaxID=3394320 RepID=UPI0039FCDF2D
MVLIPMLIVMMTDDPNSSVFSNIVVNTLIILVILGKMITVLEKRKGNKRYAPDIGAVIGLSILFKQRRS